LSKADIYFWVEQRRQKRRKIDVLLQFLYVLMKFTLPADEVTYIFIFSLQMIEVRYPMTLAVVAFQVCRIQEAINGILEEAEASNKNSGELRKWHLQNASE